MKKIMTVIGVAAFVLATATSNLNGQTIVSSSNAPAQFFPTNLPVAATSFLNDVANWTTSFNTNNLWSAQAFQVDSGVATITGGNIADRLNLARNFGAFEVGIMGQFQGIGSAFGEVEGMVGYDLVEEYDFKLVVEVSGGYDFDKTSTDTVFTPATKKAKAITTITARTGAMVAEPTLAAYKMLTAKTYAAVKYGFPIESAGKFNNLGVFYVGAGFTF